ncbi:hypothetical protein EON65_34040 [archaeon]|nr:MAG: hypothetical protein EON65_34040 [archaeon]
MMRDPDNIDTITQQKLYDVRRQLWFGGLKGLLGGTFFGLAACVAIRYTKLDLKLDKMKGVMIIMGMGCFCSYLGAVSYGSNAFNATFRPWTKERLAINSVSLKSNVSALVMSVQVA